MMEYFKAFGHSIINPSIIKLPCWSEYISAMPARALFFVLTQRTKSQVSKEVSLRTGPYRTSRQNHGPKPFAAFTLLACASGKNFYALTAALSLHRSAGFRPKLLYWRGKSLLLVGICKSARFMDRDYKSRPTISFNCFLKVVKANCNCAGHKNSPHTNPKSRIHFCRVFRLYKAFIINITPLYDTRFV